MKQTPNGSWNTAYDSDPISLKEMVREVLHHHPPARNSDEELIIRLYIEFDGMSTVTLPAIALFKMIEMDLLPDPDNIRRLRAEWQNDECKYLPSDEQVREKRWKNSKNYKHLSKEGRDDLYRQWCEDAEKGGIPL